MALSDGGKPSRRSLHSRYKHPKRVRHNKTSENTLVGDFFLAGLVRWLRRSAAKQKDCRFDSPLLLTLLFKKCDLWTLSFDFALHNNIKETHIAAHLSEEIIMVVTM